MSRRRYEWRVYEEIFDPSDGVFLRLMASWKSESAALRYMDTLYRECHDLGLDCSFSCERFEVHPVLLEEFQPL